MGISDKDRELWRMTMKDVKPLHVCQVPLAPMTQKSSPPPNTVKHTWDLHGMTLKDAHDLTLNQIEDLKHSHKYATFITGKSGIMKQEFTHWLDQNPLVRKVDVINGGGAYRVWFKKDRQKKS
jgi:DNA-nicking Smr family endonuclease